MIDQGEKDDKIIAVCADDPEYRHFKDIKELPPHRLAEIRRFFEDCESYSAFYIFATLHFGLSFLIVPVFAGSSIFLPSAHYLACSHNRQEE